MSNYSINLIDPDQLGYDITSDGLTKENNLLKKLFSKNINNSLILTLISKLLLLQLMSNAQNKKVSCIAFNMTTKYVEAEAVNSPANRRGKCEDIENETLSDILHAETKVLLDLNVENFNDILLLCTDSPCMRCASHIVYKGIKHLIFKKVHKENIHSILYLLANKVNCYQIVTDNNIIKLENLKEKYKIALINFSNTYKYYPEKILQQKEYSEYSLKQ